MLETKGKNIEYLLKYRQGKIEMGKEIGCPRFDNHFRHKDGEFTVILGHDNMGKTTWTLWYFLCLSTHYDLTWTVWTGENRTWVALVTLIQFYTGRRFHDLTADEIRTAQMIIEQWFTFVDNSQRYTPADMLKLFEDSEDDAFFIDPFTGLDRGYGFSDNYEFLNDIRHFCNSTKKALYLSTHPNSESGRAGRLYPKDHDWHGHLMPPLKDHVEGGKSFTNRVDNVLIVHRLTKHPEMQWFTMVDVAKVRETITGGRQTMLNDPIMFEWNNGLGFKEGHHEGIKREKDTLPF